MTYRSLTLYKPGLNTTCPTTPAIDAIIAQYATGKNKQNIEGEIRIAFRDALCNDGRIAVSTRVYDGLYNSKVRNKIIQAINQFTTIVENYCPDFQCYQRQLKPEFNPKSHTNPSNAYSKKVRHYMVPDSLVSEGPVSMDSYNPMVSEANEAFVLLLGSPCEGCQTIELDKRWYQERMEKWRSLVFSQPTWNLNYCTGESLCGQAILESLSKVSLPTKIDFGSLTGEKLIHATNFHLKLIQASIPGIVVRRSGRLYHWLLFANKLIRRSAWLDGQPTAELDAHAMFHCLHVARMSPSRERDELISALKSGTFYDPFFADYYQFYCGSPEDYRTIVKQQIQRQLLFTKDFRHNERQLMDTCQRVYPEYTRYLTAIQNKYTNVSHRAKALFLRESEIWIDRILVDVFDKGSRPVLSYHDGIQVRQSDAIQAKEIAEEILKEELGFAPLLRINYHSTQSPKSDTINRSEPFLAGGSALPTATASL